MGLFWCASYLPYCDGENTAWTTLADFFVHSRVRTMTTNDTDHKQIME